MRKIIMYASVAMMGINVQQAMAEATAAPAGSGANSTDNSSGGLTEIIVTAERFEESAQKTPLVINTISSDELTGVSDIRQLQTVNPGIQFSPAGNIIETFIRGVGTLAANDTQESAVAYNVDGVFLFTSTMITPLMYDLDRIEVLKGPQGTLYGRNASGGAVNLITTGAKLNKTEGYAEGELGNFNLRRATAAINLPIGETAAVRFAGTHIQHSGYLSDHTDDQDLTAGRLRGIWEPSSAVTLQLGVNISHQAGYGAGSSINPNPTGDPWVGGRDPRLQTGSPFVGGTSLLSFPPNPAPYLRDSQWSVNAQLDADLGFGTLTVLPAYHFERLKDRTYIPGFDAGEHTGSHQKSLELRLANWSKALKWVLGAYYFNIDQNTEDLVRNESNFQDAAVPFENNVKSYAFFGESTFSVTDTFRLIGGLRYTHEETRENGVTNAAIGPPNIINPITGLPNVQTTAYNPFNPFTNPTGEILDYPVANSSQAHAVTWKGGAEYDLTPSSMLFATASRGFKGGGTYVDVPGANQSFKPEFLTAFELGSRNRFLDNSLQLNVEGFYWKLKDQQIPYLGFNSIAQVTFLTANAGRGHMYGGNVDALYKLTRDDTVHVSVEYAQTQYDSFIRVEPSLAILPGTACKVTGFDPTPGSLQAATFDCSGLPMLQAPKWSGAASYQHRFALPDDSDILVDGDMTIGSSRYLESSYLPLMKQGGQDLFNSRLTYRSPGDRFEVMFWIRNIADRRIISGGAQFVPLYGRPTLLPPRTFGGSVRYNF